MTQRALISMGLGLSLLVLPAAGYAESEQQGLTGVTLYEISERVMFDPQSVKRRCDHRTGEDITVAIQVFRGRVDHETSAELDGTCQDRGRRGAVDRNAHIHGVGNFCHGREVRDIPHWIGWRLHPQKARTTGADGRSHLGEVRGVDELDVEPPRHCELR